MQTRDEVEGLHNCGEFSQPLECLYQALQTQEKSFLLLLWNNFSKNYHAGKDKRNHFIDQNVCSYNIDLTMGFLNWPVKTYILKIWWWRVYNLCIFTSHNHVYILSCKHASRPVRVRVLSYLFYNSCLSIRVGQASLFPTPKSQRNNHSPRQVSAMPW